jgi:hypothetical protein
MPNPDEMHVTMAVDRLHVSGFNTHSVLEGKEQTHMLRALTETLLVMG